MNFLVVTGLSGSGKSGTIHALEDIGFYCVDNMPPELIPRFFDICKDSKTEFKKIAIVTDTRSGDMFLKLSTTVDEMQKKGLDLKVLFLDATEDVLIKRFKETRRKHPLYEHANNSLTEAIAQERDMLLSVKGMADYYLDTSNLSNAQLKERINSIFLEHVEESMQITLMSFGFKYGANTEADLIFDVRCLPNPFYIPELKPLTGLDERVQEFVMGNEQAQTLFKKLADLVEFLIPLYIKEGKSQLVIAFGCTGGKHRSVTFAEKMYNFLDKRSYKIKITHRDTKKAAPSDFTPVEK